MNSDAKQCPSCGDWRLKDEACNYVTCNNNHDGIQSPCAIPWCFVCVKVKGIGEDKCNDKSHNSH